MKIRNEILMREVDSLIPYIRNNKKHSQEQIDLLASIIKEFGFNVPLLIDKNNSIICGHGRLLAAKKLNISSIPVILADDLNPMQIKALRIADNRIAEMATTDWEMLKIEYDELKLDYDDFNLTGYCDDDFDEYLREQEAGKQIEEVEADDPNAIETNIKYGDVWALGKHRLMCGDSTKSEDVGLLMLNEKADILFTDPPYGIDVVNLKKVGVSSPTGFGKVGTTPVVPAKQYRKIIGDDKPFDPTFLIKLNIDKKIIFGGNCFASGLPDNPHWLVWDKKYGKGSDHNNFSDCELMWTNINKKSVRVYRYLWSGLLREGKRDIELKERVHPTQKPVGLLCEILLDYSKENDIVLDLFGGSGSTLIAAEQLNRKCLMMELDEKYCQVIINRWEKLTGETAVKL